MTIAVLLVIALIALLGIRGALRRSFAARLRSSVDKVMAGLWMRLSLAYCARYSVDTAKSLAAAVVNDLFARSNSSFAAEHTELLRTELKSLQLDADSRVALTLAARAAGVAAMATRGNPLAVFTALYERGLLQSNVPDEGPAAFHSFAERYLSESKALAAPILPAA